MSATATNRQIRSNRRTFTVQEQLRAKLGTKAYGALLDTLNATAKPKRRRRK